MRDPPLDYPGAPAFTKEALEEAAWEFLKCTRNRVRREEDAQVPEASSDDLDLFAEYGPVHACSTHSRTLYCSMILPSQYASYPNGYAVIAPSSLWVLTYQPHYLARANTATETKTQHK